MSVDLRADRARSGPSEEQLRAVKRFGADRAQGFLFGRPEPLADAILGPSCEVA
jgi:hypothetical protein